LKPGNEVIPIKAEEKDLEMPKKRPWKHPQAWVPREISFYLFLAPFLFWPLAAAFLVIQFFSQDLDGVRVNELRNVSLPTVSYVFAGDGRTIMAELYDTHRLIVPLGYVPPMVRNAFIAAEDNAFYSHQGIDLFSIGRAALANFKTGEVSQGASTITQQTITYFFLNKEKSYARKLSEAILSWKAERLLSKDEILGLYLNIVYMGRRNTYGVESASRLYFGKSVKDLNLAEAAMLAGAAQGPNKIAPQTGSKESRDRQLYVLERMVENGYINRDEAMEAMRMPLYYLAVRPNYYLETAPQFADVVIQWGKERFGERKLYNEGYRIFTTLDFKNQAMARKALGNGLMALAKRHGYGPIVRYLSREEAGIFQENARVSLSKRSLSPDMEPSGLVFEIRSSGENQGVFVAIGDEIGFLPIDKLKWHLKGRKLSDVYRINALVMTKLIYKDPANGVWLMDLSPPPDIQGALVLIENSTGKVLAMHGGRDFGIEGVGRNDFNRAILAKRQPGSAFKPFVYTAAIDNGYTEASVVYDVPVSYQDGPGHYYSPKNYAGGHSGGMDLNTAILKSVNVIAVKVAHAIGPEKVVDYAHKMGVNSRMEPYLSLALGSFELSLFELTKAYTTFPNLGSYIEPTFVERVEDRYGNPIYVSEPVLHPAVSPQTAYIMLDMLSGVTKRGTAARVSQALKVPVAGKTGTSNDNADVWFIGFTPEYTCGVWVGRDSSRDSLGYNEQGGRAAAPIFIEFMKDFLSDKKTGNFKVPEGLKRGGRAVGPEDVKRLGNGSYLFKKGEEGMGREDHDMGDWEDYEYYEENVFFGTPDNPYDPAGVYQRDMDRRLEDYLAGFSGY
jgi:penicillin-binding protein 1A